MEVGQFLGLNLLTVCTNNIFVETLSPFPVVISVQSISADKAPVKKGPA
jgi:hypothetical protein